MSDELTMADRADDALSGLMDVVRTVSELRALLAIRDAREVVETTSWGGIDRATLEERAARAESDRKDLAAKLELVEADRDNLRMLVDAAKDRVFYSREAHDAVQAALVAWRTGKSPDMAVEKLSDLFGPTDPAE